MSLSYALDAERLISLRFALLEKLEPGVGFKAMFLWLHCPPGVAKVCAGATPSVVLPVAMDTWKRPQDPSQYSALGSRHQSMGINT